MWGWGPAPPEAPLLALARAAWTQARASASTSSLLVRRPGVHEPCSSPSQRDCQGEETGQCEVFGVPRALGSALSGQAPGGRPCAGPSPQVAGAPAGHPTGSSTLRALGRRAADASAAAGPLEHGVLAAMARGPALVGGSRGEV